MHQTIYTTPTIYELAGMVMCGSAVQAYDSGILLMFLILSFLEIRAERRQKSISVEFNFAAFFAFKRHVPAAYIFVLLTIA